MDNRIALPALAVASLLGLAGFGYGAYQAGLSRTPLQTDVTTTEQPATEARAPAVATAPAPAVTTPVMTAPVVAVPVVAAPAPRPQVAHVTHVEPIVTTWQAPRQVCEAVTVQRQAPVRDERRVAGTLLGAAIGGVVGHQFGGGSGKDAATVAGAIAGGYAGNRVQAGRQQANTYTTTEQQCHTVMEPQSRTDGYQVTYRLGNDTGTLRMDQRPGDTLPVRNGVVRAY
jgi:uncharacterized protein YcfJ